MRILVNGHTLNGHPTSVLGVQSKYHGQDLAFALFVSGIDTGSIHTFSDGKGM